MIVDDERFAEAFQIVMDRIKQRQAALVQEIPQSVRSRPRRLRLVWDASQSDASDKKS